MVYPISIMKYQQLITPSFSSMILFISISLILKMNHQIQAHTFLEVGLFFTLVFIVLAIVEVQQSKFISKQDKWFWTLGFLFTGLIAGIAYMLYGRKRVIGK